MTDLADEFYLATGLVLGERTLPRVAAFVAAREAAAAMAEREACAAAFRRCPFDDASCDIAETEPCPVCGDLGSADAVLSGRCGDPEAIIRARPAPAGADALAAMLAQARREGIEAAAQTAADHDVQPRISWEDDLCAGCNQEGYLTARDQITAAIRALLDAQPDADLARDYHAWAEGRSDG